MKAVFRLTKFSKLLPSIYIICISSLLYFAFSHWGYDDPFITYRYAENLSRGLGMVYNPGERILSTTTPLFTILLSLPSILWSNTPQLARLIGALSLALGGLLIWDLARSWKIPAVGWAGLLLYPTFPLLVSTLGSETPLYLAFCLGAFAFYARQKYSLTAALAALAVLTRPDGALVPLLLAADYVLRVRRPIPWPAVIVFLSITLPWFIFAWAYFGSPIPVTLAAKQHQGAMTISQRFGPGFLTIARGYAKRWQYWLEAALALLGIFLMALRARRWALFLTWTTLYFLVYSILGVSRYFWYYAPLVPGFVAAVGLGISAVSRQPLAVSYLPSATGEKESNTSDRRSVSSSRFSTIMPVAVVALLGVAQIGNLWQLRQQPDQRILAYRAVGEWLKENTPQDSWVGALEIGMIGYYAQRQMVDFAGLIQPDVAVQLTRDTTYEDAAIWAMEQYRPEFLVLHVGLFPRLEQGYVDQNCQVLRRFPGESYGYTHDLDIYACQ